MTVMTVCCTLLLLRPFARDQPLCRTSVFPFVFIERLFARPAKPSQLARPIVACGQPVSGSLFFSFVIFQCSDSTQCSDLTLCDDTALGFSLGSGLSNLLLFPLYPRPPQLFPFCCHFGLYPPWTPRKISPVRSNISNRRYLFHLCLRAQSSCPCCP